MGFEPNTGTAGRSQGTAAPREVQRVRDMPARGRTRAPLGGSIRWVFQWPYRGILAFLLWVRAKPWQLTAASPVLVCLSGVFIITGDWFVAGWVLLAGGLCDVFDGSVARHRGEVNARARSWTPLIDRVADAIVFACLFWSFADRGDTLEASLALVTLDRLAQRLATCAPRPRPRVSASPKDCSSGSNGSLRRRSPCLSPG